MASPTPFPGAAAPTAAAAVDAFLAARHLAPGSRRVYRLTLDELVEALGPDRALDELDARQVAAAAEDRWGQAPPTTWNRVVATVTSWARWCARQGWTGRDLAAGLERRRVPGDETRAIPHAQLEALWARTDVSLRDKTLWRLLYETAARAEEILGLDVADLDLANKRAVVTGKGGGREVVHWQTGAARLLPRLMERRHAGPVFLTHRKPSNRNAPASVDLCPVTGRARLSYRRAAEAFTDATGYTLHQLRHSALTHLAEEGVDSLMLAAKSRHHDVRTLARYARPGPEAVARMTAEHDPARRRR